MSFFFRLFRRRKYTTREKINFSWLRLRQSSRPRLIRFETHAARTHRRHVLLIFLGIVILLGVIFFLLQSPYFQIKNIKISGETSLAESSAIALLSPFLGQNIFLINTMDIYEKVTTEYPTIENLHIYRRWPDTISIRANDFPVAWVLTQISLNSASHYLLDTAGFVTGKATPEKTIDLPLLELVSDKKLNAKEAVLTPEFLTQLLELDKNIKSQFNLKILKYKILDIAQEVHLLLENNWTLYLSFNRDWGEIISNLAETLRGQDLSELDFEYIDLRIPNKIFFQER